MRYLVTIFYVSIFFVGCSNTWRGVKADFRDDLGWSKNKIYQGVDWSKEKVHDGSDWVSEKTAN